MLTKAVALLSGALVLASCNSPPDAASGDRQESAAEAAPLPLSLPELRPKRPPIRAPPAAVLGALGVRRGRGPDGAEPSCDLRRDEPPRRHGTDE